ncbi:MAG: GNAT family N-acetyltransferase [Candidatus Eremiobacteraeota bacterium]|nr:GNAT family N-acetyltransferase [Candidatus Eremiobacteraeota bacterium]
MEPLESLDPLVVRAVEPHDAAAWLDMELALWPDANHAELAEETASYFAGANAFITVAFVALLHDSPVGFLQLNLRPYAEGALNSPVPHIEGWYVKPAARRKHVGRALMDAAESWARNNGFTELTSDTTLDYEASPLAHAQLGFREVERLITFHKQLPP